MAILTADALVEQYRVEQAKVASKAAKGVQEAMDAFLDPYNLDKSFGAYAAAAKQVVDVYAKDAAALGGGFYLAHREAMSVFDAVPAIAWQSRVAPAALNVSLLVTGPVTVKKAISQGATIQQAMGSAQARSAGMAYRHVANSGRGTIASTVLRDKRALGFARVTDGRPCWFCAMLASRGAVYKTEETALLANGTHKYHDHCGCFVVPQYDGSDPWPGMGPEFRDMWESTRDPMGHANAHEFRKLYESRYPKGTNPGQILEDALTAKAKEREQAILSSLFDSDAVKQAALEKKWKDKPAPKSPGSPPHPPEPGIPDPTDWDHWMTGVTTRYESSPVYKGKPIQSSNNWNQFEKAMAGGPEARTALKFLRDNQYLDDALHSEAISVLDAAAVVSPEKAKAYKSALQSWRNRTTRYKRYVEEWRSVNPNAATMAGLDDALDFANDSAAVQWANANLTVPSGHARSALKRYTGHDYDPWNRALRQADGADLDSSSPWATPTKTADKGFSPAPEAFIARRGTDMREFEFPDGTRSYSIPPPDPSELIGTVQVQRGYISSSMGTSPGFSSRDVWIEYRVPERHPVAWAMPYSHYASEREIILSRDTYYFIHDVYKSEGRWVVEAEILPEGVDPASLGGAMTRPRTQKSAGRGVGPRNP